MVEPTEVFGTETRGERSGSRLGFIAKWTAPIYTFRASHTPLNMRGLTISGTFDYCVCSFRSAAYERVFHNISPRVRMCVPVRWCAVVGPFVEVFSVF